MGSIPPLELFPELHETSHMISIFNFHVFSFNLVQGKPHTMQVEKIALTNTELAEHENLTCTVPQ